MARRPLCVLLLGTSLAGCDFDLGPAAVSVPGSFALRTDSPVEWANSSVRVTILADTLHLLRDGVGLRSSLERLDFSSPAVRDTTVASRATYLYRIEDGRIEVDFPCPPTALCSPPPHMWGSVAEDDLDLRALVDPGLRLRYRRVPG